MLIQGLTGLAAATGRARRPAGAGRRRLRRPDRRDQHGLRHPQRALLARALRRGPGDQGRPAVRACSQHQNQELVWVMNFGEDFERPNSVDRPSRHGRAVRRLSDQRRLGDDRDEPLPQAGRRARRAGACSPTTTRGRSSTSATRSGRRSPPRRASGPRPTCWRRCSRSTSGAARSRATSGDGRPAGQAPRPDRHLRASPGRHRQGGRPRGAAERDAARDRPAGADRRPAQRRRSCASSASPRR